MGNRAVVQFKGEAEKVGVYLHWNGGPESVMAFVQEMVDRNWVRTDYAPARMCGIVSEYFDADGKDDRGTSLGVYPIEETSGMADYDNGLFQVQLSSYGYKMIQTNPHNGTPKTVSLKDLDADGLKSYEEILKQLKEIRAKRKGNDKC